MGSQSLASRMNAAGDIEVVLFDVGGVIVRLADITTLGTFNGLTDAAAIKALWGRCAIVQAHERGELAPEDFATRMVDAYSMDCPPDEFLARFSAWPREIFPGVADLLADMDPRLRVACLSNTSDIHWRTQIAAADLARLFELQFLSYKLGIMKPDLRIYSHVARAMNVAPDRILFFDDTSDNVDGALAAGFDAHRVNGPGDARAILERYGLLRAGNTSSGST
jgi:glucose-1-phosphatase